MQGRMNPESRLPKFYQKSLLERQKLIDFNPEAKLNIQTADKMIENVVGVFGLPLGVAANFVIDNQPVLVPMCTEEASIIAPSGTRVTSTR